MTNNNKSKGGDIWQCRHILSIIYLRLLRGIDKSMSTFFLVDILFYEKRWNKLPIDIT
jgi:hypothetical protein